MSSMSWSGVENFFTGFLQLESCPFLYENWQLLRNQKIDPILQCDLTENVWYELHGT